MRTTTTHYDIAEHLRTSEEMAAYLEACIVEADGDAAFIAKALGDIARAQGDDPGGPRLRSFQGKPLQGLIWRAEPELGHHPEGRLGPWPEVERQCEK
jgi:hypothetical protein